MIAADELKDATDLQELPRLDLAHIRKVYTHKTEAHDYFSQKKNHLNLAYFNIVR